MYNILRQLRDTSSTKEKLNILLNNKDNELLKCVLKYTYDKVTYTYGVTSRTVLTYETDNIVRGKFFNEILEELNNRTVTGHKALELCKGFINSLDDREVIDTFLMIIDRDLKVGVSVKTINKVWKNLIERPNYCRCDVFSKKTASKIVYPAYIQLKCDGTYREAYVHDGIVEFKTRSGEPYENPVLAEEMKTLPDGYYTGEFTIGKADDPDMNRSEGNGNINSDNPDYENIHFTVWDYLTEDEYTLKTCRDYEKRFENLKNNIDSIDSNRVHLVPSIVVYNVESALYNVSEWMNKGLEGGVLKSAKMKFKNGTSKEQLKIKLKVDIEVRCVGFLLGTKGTKYENQNKVILFETDDKKIKGQCSGMTDLMVDEVTKNPEKYIGKVLTVQFNDLTKAEGHEYYALSHPRFAEWREHDKDETDTLEKAIQLRDMARNL